MFSFIKNQFLFATAFFSMLWPTSPLNADGATSIISITQTMHLYSYLVDNGGISQLGRVFASNATANFNLPGIGIAHGLPEIIQHVDMYSNVTSQHALTTNYVQLLSHKTANASTDLTSTFFGKGNQLGEIYVAYGTYNTDWTITEDGWRINNMTFIPLGAWGNVSINYPEGAPPA